MNPTATVASAQAEAERLAAEVRDHKSAQRFHRNEARRAAARLDAFRRECENRGIPIIIESQPKEAQTNDTQRTATRT